MDHICLKMKTFQNTAYAIENEIEEEEVEEHKQKQEDDYYEQYGIEYNDGNDYGQSNHSQDWYDVLEEKEVELLVRALLDNFVWILDTGLDQFSQPLEAVQTYPTIVHFTKNFIHTTKRRVL